jgi:uridine phosphorylase
MLALLSLTIGDVVVPAASPSSLGMSNQYTPSNLISYFTLSVVVDVCVLLTSLLGNNMLVSFTVVYDLYLEFNLESVYVFSNPKILL